MADDGGGHQGRYRTVPDRARQSGKTVRQLWHQSGRRDGSRRWLAGAGDDVLRKLALNLAGVALSQGLKPLQSLARSLFFPGLLGGLGGASLPRRRGVVPFASGGVVSSPTYFPMGRQVGLMGEAGGRGDPAAAARC